MKKILLITTAAMALSAVPANAAHTVYTDRASFDAATGGGLSFESFEALPAEMLPSPTLTYTGFTVSETNGADALTNTILNGFFSSATTDGSHSTWYDDNDDSLLTFLFASPIDAFGIDFAASAGGTMTYSGGAGGSFSIGAANSPVFFGFTSPTAFTSITFDMSGGPEVGFDALSFGAVGVVPEPATWAFMIFGFGAIGGAMRSRRKQSLAVSYS